MIEAAVLEKLLKRVEKPARYIGGEVNSVKKEIKAGLLRFGFAFPDMYEIGMSYLGMQILYDILNSHDDIYCERIFAPAPDMEKLLREENVALFTLESKSEVKELDILGFTLQYEMCYTNVLNILELSGIPLHSEERLNSEEDFPFVVAGGPCSFNPEPLAAFIDIFMLGDGEEALPELCKAYKGWKASGEGRKKIDFLRAAAKIDGVYIPSFYEAEYLPDGKIAGIRRTDEAAPEKVEKAMLHDIESAHFPTKNVVPYIEVVHDRAVVETFRGCTRGCRFCQAGMIYRPVRERRAETVEGLSLEQLKNTGHEELSLLSLSTSDHSEFETLATGLMSLCRAQNVALSLPSLRLDSFSFGVLNEIQKYKKSGLTFAPEAGTQRLRDVINKGIREEDIYSAVRQAIELDWLHIKLYFMIGLPTETEEDLDGIVEIAKNIVEIYKEMHLGKIGRFRVSVSVSNFVPKAHTPFQWAAQDSMDSLIKKHDYLRGRLKMKGVSFTYHDTCTSALEGVFARGDRRCAAVLERAFRLGCRFDGWSEYLNGELWKRAFDESGISMDFYNTRERSYDEKLPWDTVGCRISKEFLIRENEKAKAAETSPDCRRGCLGCGIQNSMKCPLGGALK